MMNDSVANVLSAIMNHERVGKRELTVHPVSKVIKRVLEIMRDKGYVGELEVLSASRGGVGRLHLLGNVNKCGVIKPRFSTNVDDFLKFVQRYLPASNVGVLIVSTPLGMMTHSEAREQNVGGRLIAYCY